MICLQKYRNDPKFSDRYAWANSADPDQTAPKSTNFEQRVQKDRKSMVNHWKMVKMWNNIIIRYTVKILKFWTP